MHERSDAVPIHLRRGEHRRADPPAQPPLGLPGPDCGHELPTAAAVRPARTSGATTSARPAAPCSSWSCARPLQTEPRRSPVPQGLRGLPACPCYRRPICFSHPEPSLPSQLRTGYSPLCQCQRQRPGVRGQRLRECGRHPISIPGAGVDIIWGQHCSSVPGGESHRRAQRIGLEALVTCLKPFHPPAPPPSQKTLLLAPLYGALLCLEFFLKQI